MNTDRLDQLDARQRAARTLVQGLAVDLALAIALGVAAALLPILNGTEPEALLRPEVWLVLLAATIKSALVALVSYVARLRSAPPPLA